VTDLSNVITDAVLSLNSYDVGDEASLILDENAVGKKIGNYTVKRISAFSKNGNHSFVAIAYQDDDGNIVISYRGTDKIDANYTSDPRQGWEVGAGSWNCRRHERVGGRGNPRLLGESVGTGLSGHSRYRRRDSRCLRDRRYRRNHGLPSSRGHQGLGAGEVADGSGRRRFRSHANAEPQPADLH